MTLHHLLGAQQDSGGLGWGRGAESSTSVRHVPRVKGQPHQGLLTLGDRFPGDFCVPGPVTTHVAAAVITWCGITCGDRGDGDREQEVEPCNHTARPVLQEKTHWSGKGRGLRGGVQRVSKQR